MPKGGNPTTAKEKQRKKKILIMQLENPNRLTIDQIATVVRVQQRQAYQWVRQLEEEGYDVIMRRNPRDRQLYYSILM